MNRTNIDPYIRHNIRYKGYDYSKVGYYFVTICCFDKICRFGKIEDNEMIINEFGNIACDEWIDIPNKYENVAVDVFQIMPNHLHGIIVIIDDFWVGGNRPSVVTSLADDSYINSGASPVTTENTLIDARKKPLLGDIIGAYKSIVFNKCLKISKSRNEYMGKLWQNNYWEHINRDEKAYYEIGNYIFNNPVNWKDDEYYYEL